MGMMQIEKPAADPVMMALVAGMEREFGHEVSEALARRFLEAEAVDFLWEARVAERWMGAYLGDEGDGLELDRVAILTRFDGRWVVAQMIVDGDGWAHGLIAQRHFQRRDRAQIAFSRA